MVQKNRDIPKKGRGRPPGGRDVRRVTVALEPEVHDVFKKMAEAAGVSLARTIGDWCRDTADGAAFITERVVQVRKSPAVLMRDAHLGAAQRLNDEIVVDRLRQHDAAGGRAARSARSAGRTGGGS